MRASQITDPQHSEKTELVPEGTAPPQDLAPDIFGAALTTILGGRRLDMQQLAADLGVSRATLYRRVGDRDRLLGDVVWFLVRQALVPTLDSVRDLKGIDRVTQGVLRFLALVREPRPPFKRLIDEEPAAALRVLASKEGPVQGHLIEVTRRVICEEIDAGHLSASGDPSLVATAVVRLSESFLYGHLIAREDLDIGLLEQLIRHVLGEGAP